MSLRQDPTAPTEDTQASQQPFTIPRREVASTTSSAGSGPSQTARLLQSQPSGTRDGRSPQEGRADRPSVPVQETNTPNPVPSSLLPGHQLPPPTPSSPLPSKIAEAELFLPDATESTTRTEDKIQKTKDREHKQDKKVQGSSEVLAAANNAQEASVTDNKQAPAPISGIEKALEQKLPEVTDLSSTRKELEELAHNRPRSTPVAPHTQPAQSQNLTPSTVPNRSAHQPISQQKTPTSTKEDMASIPGGGRSMPQGRQGPATGATGPGQGAYNRSGAPLNGGGGGAPQSNAMGQYANNARSMATNTAQNISNGAERSFQWVNHQSPCAAALCALGFLLVVYLCTFVAMTLLFVTKTNISTFTKDKDLSLCGLEANIVQDPVAHMYMWWMVASGLIFVFLLFYNGVAWWWYCNRKNKGFFQWIREKTENHRKKKIRQKKAKMDEAEEKKEAYYFGMVQQQTGKFPVGADAYQDHGQNQGYGQSQQQSMRPRR